MLILKGLNDSSKDSELPSQIPPEPHDNTGKPDTPSGAIPGAVKDQHSNYSLSIWEYLIEEIGLEGEVKQSEIANAVGCSRRTVIRVLNGFRRCNLIDWESYQGQGRGIQLKNLWLEKGKKIANKLAWKRGYEAEDEYLRTQWTRQGQLGVTPLDHNINIEKTTATKDQNLGFDSSSKFINNNNLTPQECRKRWLEQFSDDKKTSAREGFQEVIMEDLRKYLEGENLDPKAVKATTDSFWKGIKQGTLGQAREALRSLKDSVLDLISEIENSLANSLRDFYEVANKFIYFKVLKSSENRQEDESNRPRESTPETYAQDKAKAKRTRQEDTSAIIGEIFDSDSFSLGSGKGKEDRPEEKKNLLETMEKTLQNYGKLGLKRWCRNHRVSFETAKEQLTSWKPERANKLENRE